MNKKINKLLIANRGEIACRIIQTARTLGIDTVAVYSTPDANARHVALADEAVHIGEAAPQASYLDHAAVLDAARRTGADAIHPGYGFLSENATFAEACATAGVLFVGPPASAITAMGSKSAAKHIMADAGVPLLPGYHGDEQSDETLASAAADIGYPVLLKAAAGGGGKGMRIVNDASQFASALHNARQEARSAFGDDHMLVEKFLAAPRHVEVQVFADQHGNCVHLHDRDCSIQRRYQKIIEEAPAPGLSDRLRQRMAEAAVAAARAIDYVGAGTVEFLVEDGDFYFMEMNTRLQVEHPVTEAITGIDLVAWQLAVAEGQPLPATQSEIERRGHAIEARIYAEDADGGFLPTPGPIHGLRWPSNGSAARIDTGVRSGDAVSIHYDPMIAKMIVHAEDRQTAIRGLVRSLETTLITGLTTNVDFLLRVLSAEAFGATIPTTSFLNSEADRLLPGSADPLTIALSAIALWHTRRAQQPRSPWHTGTGWWPNVMPHTNLRVSVGDVQHEVTIEFDADETLPARVTWGDECVAFSALTIDDERIEFVHEQHQRRAHYLLTGTSGLIALDARQWTLAAVPPDLGEALDSQSDGTLRAPMTGRIVEVPVSAGERVNEGDTILVMEAMKMAHTLKAPMAGTLASCTVSAGDLVDGGQVLATIEPLEASD